MKAKKIWNIKIEKARKERETSRFWVFVSKAKKKTVCFDTQQFNNLIITLFSNAVVMAIVVMVVPLLLALCTCNCFINCFPVFVQAYKKEQYILCNLSFSLHCMTVHSLLAYISFLSCICAISKQFLEFFFSQSIMDQIEREKGVQSIINCIDFLPHIDSLKRKRELSKMLSFKEKIVS